MPDLLVRHNRSELSLVHLLYFILLFHSNNGTNNIAVISLTFITNSINAMPSIQIAKFKAA